MDSSTPQPRPVVVLIDSLLAGGGERVAVETACALDRSRFAPHVLVSRGTGPLEATLVRHSVPFTFLGRRRGFSPRRFVRAHRIIRRADLLHAHKFGSSVWASLLARTTRVPLVTHEHTWNGERSAARRFGYRWLIGPVAARILCVSERIASSVISDGAPAERVQIVPNGVAPEKALGRAEARAELRLPDDAFVAGIVARLRPEKAHEVLLEAVARARTETTVILCVVGDGTRREELQDLADRLGIADIVVWSGEQPDAGRLFSAFDVSVICSRFEALPLAALEALGAGVPLVATAVGALPDLLAGGAGTVVPVGDSDAIADALVSLAEDASRRVEMGAVGRDLVARDYSLARSVALVEGVYDDVLTPTRGAA
jgi:glycosyltransferase involved in cell wall biosynthesis